VEWKQKAVSTYFGNVTKLEKYGQPLIDSSGVHFNEFVDLLWHLKFVQHFGDEILELVITIAWSIWFNQNQVWQGKADQSANMIIHKARSMIEEFQVANFQPSGSSMKEVELWINPKPPWYKINIDGAVFLQQHANGCGRSYS